MSNWTIIVWYFSVRKKWIWKISRSETKSKYLLLGLRQVIADGQSGGSESGRGNTYKTYQSYNIRVTLVWFKDLVQNPWVNIFQLDVPVFELPLDTFWDVSSTYKHVFFNVTNRKYFRSAPKWNLFKVMCSNKSSTL